MSALGTVTLLTDYGTDDEFAGICRAVIARIAPDAAVIDFGHGVPPGDVAQGAVRLADAVGHAPPAVHLAVVDPGVGGPRKAIAIRTGSGFLVGPDNGLLIPAAERLGGIAEAVVLDQSQAPSRTFHGRDIFAPAAARLAAGAPMSELGRPGAPSSLVRFEIPMRPRAGAGELLAAVLTEDRFGNLSLGAVAEDLARLTASGPLWVEAMGATSGNTLDTGPKRVSIGSTFSDVDPGEPVLLTDSSGRLALCANGESAAQSFGAGPGDWIRLRPTPE